MISDYTVAEWNDLQDRLAGGPGWRAYLTKVREQEQRERHRTRRAARHAELSRIKGFKGDARKYGIWIEA